MPAPRVLREYALLADGERGALIGPDGTVAWLCVPRWDSPAVLPGCSAAPAGTRVTPADRWHVWGGYYENGSADLAQPLGRRRRIECREALAMPADPHRAVLLRRIEALDGDVRVDVRARPAGRLRARPMTDLAAAQDANTGTYGRGRSGPLGSAGPGPGRARHVDGGAGDDGRTGRGRAPRSRSGDLGPGTGPAAARAGGLLGGDRGSLVAGGPRLRRPDRGRRRAARLRGAARADLGERRHGGRRHHVAARAAGRRRGTTTTATRGSGTSATRGSPSPPTDRTRCWPTPSGSSPSGCSPTGRGSCPRTRWRRADRRRAGAAAARLPRRQPRSGNWVRKQFQLDAFGETLSLLAAAARHDMLGRGRLACGRRSPPTR